MSRAPSAETQLRTAKLNLRDMEKNLFRNQAELTAFRARATKAEQEVAEWKRRFDALLKILPEKP